MSVLGAAPDFGAVELTAAWELRLPTAIRLPRILDLTLGDAMIGTGWHSAELSDGVTFRWMGPAEVADIEIAVDRSVDLTVDLDIYLVVDPAFESDLRVLVDDQAEPIAYRRTLQGMSFVLPRRDGVVDTTRIVLRTAQGMVTLPDPRRLSIAFGQLRVRPAAEEGGEAARLTLRAQLAEQLRTADGAWPLRHDGELCIIVAG